MPNDPNIIGYIARYSTYSWTPHILNMQRTAYSKGWVKIANLENTYEQTEISQACERS